MTIKELANETTANTGLTVRHPWLTGADVQADLNAAILELAESDDEQYDEDADYYRAEGDEYLECYCRDRNLEDIRQLSMADAKALAIALDRGYILATDEWPLREFSQFVEPDENNQRIPIMSSLQVLKLFLDAGQMSMDKVRATARGWILSEERLPRSWQTEYRALFNEAPPDAQA
ncbi:hypothetical protein [Ramlibacter sp. 2FC]|uniref:hypothetical protein n=1 Tax=Ramlibacter sp. 2FC TaxID=2502188 RepID=UPI0010F4F82A|nr:hypothetical protein [Ramlibacter sp. 2FC]